jgi:hypothetical protein
VFAGAMALSSVAGFAQEKAKKGVPLLEAVEMFNSRADEDPIGALQEPLTTDEVVAAIRLWDRKRSRIEDATWNVFLRIADERIMPDNASLKFISECKNCNGYDCDVWWIDLQVGEGARGYSYRIRDRKIKCSVRQKDSDEIR